MLKVVDGSLYEDDLRWSEKESATVVLASGGYPDVYEKGKLITSLNEVDEDILIFHAGTKKTEQGIVTNGGRVMAITCIDDTIEKARNRIYSNIDRIDFEGKQYRKDIAQL
jgi:phosphoribosylamine---glycine ligase